MNKWDLIEEKDAQTARRGEQILVEKAPFLRYVPFLYGSALTGQRVRKVLDLILEVADAREARVATSEVNKVLEALIQQNNPPQKPGEKAFAPAAVVTFSSNEPSRSVSKTIAS